jgi:integrase
MKKVRFHLAMNKAKEKDQEKEKEKDQSGSIFAQFRYAGNRLFKSKTGLSIKKEFWDPDKQRVKTTKLFPLHVPYNQRLNKMEADIQETYYRSLAANEVPTRQDFIDALNQYKPSSDTMTLSKFLEIFLKERKESKNYAPGSSVVYRVVIKKYREFCIKSKKQYDFKDIDISFFFAFTKFLGDFNFSTNYLNKIIGTFKTILNDAKERGFNKFDHYKSKKFAIPRVKTTKFYLNEDELKKLFEFKFKDKHLRNATDLFLFGAWSSFRVSDFKKFIQENVETYKGKEIIKLQTTKTKKPIAVPLHDGIKKIIELRGFPKPISNQKLNDYIKDACKEAKIDTPMVRYTSRNSEQISTVVPKYDVITSHVARQSFATNMFLRGYPVSLIKEFMGHTTEKMTWSYICAPEDETAFRVADDAFFKL